MSLLLICFCLNGCVDDFSGCRFGWMVGFKDWRLVGLFGLELVSRLGVCSDTGGLVANWLFAGLFCLCVLRMCWFVAGVLGFACCVFVCFANLWFVLLDGGFL